MSPCSAAGALSVAAIVSLLQHTQCWSDEAHTRWCHLDVAVQGRKLGQDASSFRTEALAIDAAIEMLTNILNM